MSHAIIKNNINRLLQEKDWKVVDLEKRMGGKRTVSSILRGTSKNPTIEVLKTMANAFEVEITDIISEQKPNDDININLYSSVSHCVLELLSKKKFLKYTNLIKIIREIYDYSNNMNLKEVDKNFATWFVNKEVS